jgi:multidrug efflux pump subunit AcrA (membrane-fusion protein)
MRWMTIAIVAAMIGAAVFLVRPAFLGLSHEPGRQPAGPATDASDAPVRIFAGGTVEGSQREFSLRFEIAGRLKDVLVQPGSRVARGDVLAKLDPEIWELKFTEARTLLQLARAERDKLVRQHELIRQKQERVLSEFHAQNLKSEELAALIRDDELTIVEAKVTLAEGVLRRERIMLEKALLLAPIDGVVLRMAGEQGELVGPTDEREVVILVNRDHTRIRAYVEELDAMSVAVGQKAVVSAEGRPEREYAGIVKTCAPYVTPKSQRHLKPGELLDIRVREVIIELADGADLLIGLPVDVFIEPGVPVDGAAEPDYEDAKGSTEPQTADTASPPGRLTRRIADPKVRAAGHQTDAGRRR